MVKRKVLTIKEQLSIISELEAGRSTSDISRQFNLPKSTVSTIKKNKEKLKEAINLNVSRLRRIRKPIRKDVDNGLIRWFSYQRNQRAKITGEMLKLKAEKLGKLQNTNFTCSRGWMDRFKTRYNIVAGKIHGEAASVSKQTVSSWIKDIWPNLRRGYEDVLD
ncbi:CENP-B N-terminal DNA-binding domain [Popillia japonica]|uniref:CENP-B N-terminal DNA-binding domain n=1 Tax=Popillia japonica TaxID=7064 RepID=A0AAW1KR28_POPJA